MHVLHVETGRHLYGGALQVLYLTQGLKSRGCGSSLICPQGSGIAAAAREFATIYEIPLAGELDPGFFFRLLRILRRVRPDLLHLHSRRGADLWGIIVAKFTKTKAILTRRVDNPEPVWLARRKYTLYERVITVSEGIRRVLSSEGVPEDRIVCVPSAVDAKRYEDGCERDWFCREFRLNSDHRSIGVIAQLIPRKGHQYLIEAAPLILEHCPQTRFLFFGQGPLKEHLVQLCRKKGVGEHVHFAGFRHDLERVLPCLYMAVHPAMMEGLGVSLLQAAASELPIVATQVGGIPEIVKDGVNGYLVEAGDVRGIAQAVIALLKDPERARHFGRAGKQIVRSTFSIDAMVEGNLRVYREAIS